VSPIYPESLTVRWRKPVHYLLTADELSQARREFENRRQETERYYNRAVARNHALKRRFLAESLKRLEIERSLFFSVAELVAQSQRTSAAA